VGERERKRNRKKKALNQLKRSDVELRGSKSLRQRQH
jgi:hypothetical protein